MTEWVCSPINRTTCCPEKFCPVLIKGIAERNTLHHFTKSKGKLFITLWYVASGVLSTCNTLQNYGNRYPSIVLSLSAHATLQTLWTLDPIVVNSGFWPATFGSKSLHCFKWAIPADASTGFYFNVACIRLTYDCVRTRLVPNTFLTGWTKTKWLRKLNSKPYTR